MMQSKIENPESKIECGFTLLEVVLALTIFLLLGTTLYGVTSLSQRAVEKAQMRSEDTQQLSGMQDLLGSYIRSAHPYVIKPEIIGVYFAGEENWLSFISSASRAMGGRGISKITISWDGEEAGAGQLLLEETMPVRFDEEAGGSGIRNSLVILSRVRGFKIEYLNPQSEPKTGDENWEEEWSGADKTILPRAVRFTLRSDAGKQTQWIFPIMTQVLTPG